jgi:hypothetical protein
VSRAQILPFEVLGHIFHHLITTHLGRMRLENLLLVCRDWYNTAAYDSSIWTIIDFHPCMTDCPSHARWWRRRIQRRLTRSGKRLLDVNIDASGDCHNVDACYCNRGSPTRPVETLNLCGPNHPLDIILTIKEHSKRFKSLLISIPHRRDYFARLVANAALDFLFEAPALDRFILYDARGEIKVKEAFRLVSLPSLRYCEFRAVSGLAGLDAVYRAAELWLKVDSPWPGELPQWRIYPDGPCGLPLHRFCRLLRLDLEFPCQGRAQDVKWFGCELPHLRELTLRGPEALRADLSAFRTPSLALLRIILHKRPGSSAWVRMRYRYTDSWWDESVRKAVFASLRPLHITRVIWLDIQKASYDRLWFKKYVPEILRSVVHPCQLRLSRHWKAAIEEMLRESPLFLPGVSHILIEHDGRIDKRRVLRDKDQGSSHPVSSPSEVGCYSKNLPPPPVSSTKCIP